MSSDTIESPPPVTSLVVHFVERVEGPQPASSDRYQNDWHSFAASGLVRSGAETLFVRGDEIVESWPTELITRIEWFPVRARGRTLAEKRRRHPRAYERWPDAEDEQLRAEHAQGMTVAEMCEAHGRNQGAIVARLERLGLPIIADAEPGPDSEPATGSDQPRDG